MVSIAESQKDKHSYWGIWVNDRPPVMFQSWYIWILRDVWQRMFEWWVILLLRRCGHTSLLWRIPITLSRFFQVYCCFTTKTFFLKSFLQSSWVHLRCPIFHSACCLWFYIWLHGHLKHNWSESLNVFSFIVLSSLICIKIDKDKDETFNKHLLFVNTVKRHFKQQECRLIFCNWNFFEYLEANFLSYV